MGPEKNSLNLIFPTKYVIPKSLKFRHWPSKEKSGFDMTLFFFASDSFGSPKPPVMRSIIFRVNTTTPRHLVIPGEDRCQRTPIHIS